MPKSVTTWFCSTCNKEYKSEEEALNCESSHYEVVKIIGVKYSQGKKCPNELHVEIDIGGDKKDVSYGVIRQGWGDK